MKRITRLGGILCAVLLVSGIFAQAAQAAVTTSLVPFRMDGSNQAGWWKPIEEFNGRIYMAYNAWGGPGSTNGGATDTHTVYIAKRDTNGSWTRGCMKTAAGACVVFGDDIGHNQPTIAIDGDGYIHAFVSMHAKPWRYYRSNAPGDVASMINRSTQMPDQGGTYTYPVAARAANGDVYLAIRSHFSGHLYRWNNAANTWTRSAVFAADPSYVAYPDDIVSDGAGNVHIAWEWAYQQTGGLRHLASYMRYNPTSNQFFNAAGTQITAPANLTSAVVYQPLEGAEQSTDRDHLVDPGVQSAKLAISPVTGQAAMAYRYREVDNGPFRVRLAEWNGSAWQRQTVYAGAYDTTAALDISMYSSGLRVYYAKAQTSTGDQAFYATRQTNGTWPETSLLPGVRVERLSVIRRGTTDHLYLAVPASQDLYYGTATW